MSYDYSMGVNYMPMTSTYATQGNVATNVQENAVTNPQGNIEQDKNSDNKVSVNKDLLWAGLTGLAVLGTYLLTKGHYKAKIPASGQVAQGVSHSVETVAKPIPETVNTYLASYKPFAGVENVAEGIKPAVTNIGSRTRAEFVTTVNGETVKDIVIFNDKGNAVSRFLERTKPNDINGTTRVREAYRLKPNGEQELVQTSTRRKGDCIVRSQGTLRNINTTVDDVNIKNHTVNKTPADLPNNAGPDANSNVRELDIFRRYDKTSGHLVTETNQRTFVNSRGEEIYGAYQNERMFGYDKDGKLVSILEKNPKKEFMGDDYLYQAVKDGEVVSSHQANKFDVSILRKGGTANYSDGQIHHTLTDDEIATFSDYFSSRNTLA